MLKGITYASLGMLAVSSSLWAMYMQDNAFVIMSLLFWTSGHYMADSSL